jgi:hypothetical protein
MVVVWQRRSLKVYLLLSFILAFNSIISLIISEFSLVILFALANNPLFINQLLDILDKLEIMLALLHLWLLVAV